MMKLELLNTHLAQLCSLPSIHNWRCFLTVKSLHKFAKSENISAKKQPQRKVRTSSDLSTKAIVSRPLRWLMGLQIISSIETSGEFNWRSSLANNRRNKWQKLPSKLLTNNRRKQLKIIQSVGESGLYLGNLRQGLIVFWEIRFCRNRILSVTS
jgi:hypothetical protein